MVATVRCEEIAKEKVDQLTSDERWHELEEAVQPGIVPSFGRKLSNILDKYFSSYDMEVLYFEESVRMAKRHKLVTESLNLVYPAYQAMLGHLRSKAFNRFKDELEEAVKNGEGFAAVVRRCTKSCMEQFDQGCADAKVQQANWNFSKIQDKLRRDIDSHASSLRAAKLSELKNQFEMQLNNALAEPVASLLDTALPNTWQEIRKLLKHVAEKAASDFMSAIAGFEIDDVTAAKMIEDIKNYGRTVVEKKTREEAGQVLIRMKDRFSTVFGHDTESMPRLWNGKEDIRAITKDARSASLKLLAVMAALRLDEEPDNIEATLCSAFMDGADTSSTIVERSSSSSLNSLVSSTWEGVLPSNALITPVQCRSLWRQFKSETEYAVSQALAAQEANKRSSSWLPPAWAIVALLVLGFNEFMLLLRNPIYIGVIFVLYLLGKALWVQLDIPGEFQHGILPGILSLSTKFLPTVMNLIKRLADEGQRYGGSTQSSNNPVGLGNGSFKSVPSQNFASDPSSEASSSDASLEQSSPLRHRQLDGVSMPIS
uniref:Sey1/RHD3-like three-helix bundle domain-containing protein n=1 Tax=Araucaria cunninghamii TaxID=56994 RepID=A0A0D6QSC7_ARACU